MNIEYLVNYYTHKDDLEQYPTCHSNPEGMALDEIESLEQSMNNGAPFPKALREYLFIGGRYDVVGFDGAIEGQHKPFNDYYQRRMRERGIAVGRPCFVFDQLDGECVRFIYLDEGDDPPSWNASLHPAYDFETDDGEDLIVWRGNARFPTFSSLVEYAVDAALKGLQPW